MPTATITFGFDPILRLGPDLAVRWQTVALAVVIAAVLTWTTRSVRAARLRPDDLLSIVIGAVPGAVIVGRIAWIAAHPGIVPLDPWAWLDPSLGGVDLAAGVLGGIGGGALIASLLGVPVETWARLAAVPLLVAIGAGKLVMVLGGSGQGLPADLWWATAYDGPGPWGSLAAALPSHPSQAYEGLATLVLALATTRATGRSATPGTALLAGAVGSYAVVRAAVALTWRDPVVAGPLGATGWTAVLVAAASLAVALAVIALHERRRRGRTAQPVVDWPDPATRPRF
ncbi:MAG: prolipoprotein diacylglyceryl transferase family protein [Candidatus Limnocylindria bacterium]